MTQARSSLDPLQSAVKQEDSEELTLRVLREVRAHYQGRVL